MNKVTTAGGIVVRDGMILLIRHKGGGLAFAKGHIEENENLEAAAIREVAEETSIEASIVGYLGWLERFSTEKTGEVVKKRVELFKMSSLNKLNDPPEESPVWVRPAKAIKNMQFPEESKFLEKHINELK